MSILNLKVKVLVAQLCPTLCNPMNCGLPGSSVPGILQARTLEWIDISFSNACMHTLPLQSCRILCDLMDSSPPGSSVPGILQARILEWVAISYSRRTVWGFLKKTRKTSMMLPFQMEESKSHPVWDSSDSRHARHLVS